MYEALRENDIFARKYFYPAVNDMECYSNLNNLDTPIAHDVSMNILTLPLYEELKMEEVDKICEIIKMQSRRVVYISEPSTFYIDSRLRVAL